jgi:hypothetical protein
MWGPLNDASSARNKHTRRLTSYTLLVLMEVDYCRRLRKQ